MSELLTVRDVAAILKLSLRQVFNLLKAGKLPVGFKIGGARRWNRESLQRFLSDREMEPHGAAVQPGAAGESTSSRS